MDAGACTGGMLEASMQGLRRTWYFGITGVRCNRKLILYIIDSSYHRIGCLRIWDSLGGPLMHGYPSFHLPREKRTRKGV